MNKKENPKTKLIALRVTPSEFKSLKQNAKGNKVSISKLIRKLLGFLN